MKPSLGHEVLRELHYLEQGSGQVVISVHGGLADYREWLPAAQFLLPGYRTITYSRGTHDMCSEYPAECAAAILEFVRKH